MSHAVYFVIVISIFLNFIATIVDTINKRADASVQVIAVLSSAKMEGILNLNKTLPFPSRISELTYLNRDVKFISEVRQSVSRLCYS